jgi:hypothetical protein
MFPSKYQNTDLQHFKKRYKKVYKELLRAKFRRTCLSQQA